MKLKATIRASLWYMAAMVTAIGALLVSSGIEHSANGWEMLGWAAAALVLLAAALAMLGLGCCADKESRKGNKAHKAPADTVKIELNTGVSPAIIVPTEGEENFLYMVLPVRLKSAE